MMFTGLDVLCWKLQELLSQWKLFTFKDVLEDFTNGTFLKEKCCTLHNH